MSDTNRPTYAPDRRPGDTTITRGADLARSANQLIAIHLDPHDARIIAGLIESGAAALMHAPVAATDAVERNSRGRNAMLGWDVAASIIRETERCHARNEHRHREEAKAARKDAARKLRERAKPQQTLEVTP